MPENNQESQEARLEKLKAMIFAATTLKPHEKADILDILPKLSEENLTHFEKFFQDDQERADELFEKIITADPEFAKKLNKATSEKINQLSKRLESEDSSEEEAENLLENL